MPWTIDDVDEHKKDLTDAQKKRWVSIANGALEDCTEAGTDQAECEGRAIRVANAALNEALRLDAVPTDPGLLSLLEKLDLSFDDVRNRLRAALGKGWIRDVYDSWFVYEDGGDMVGENGKIYRRSYVIDAETGEVTLGDPIEVIIQTLYVPAQEAAALELVGDLIPLVEKSVRKDGTLPIRIIAPGWGSSGYYPAEVLERDGPRVFKAGTHAYWDHPSLSEEKDRPERSLRDLAGTLTRDAYWDANGPAGPGLYGEAKVASAYRDAVQELAPHIGMSIRAWGRGGVGEAEGRKGKVISELAAARSVDFVTTAGAGGQILELFEAAGRTPAERIDVVTEQEAQSLRDENARLTQQVAALTEAARNSRALEVATATLAEVDLPPASRLRVAAAQSLILPLAEDGALNEDAYRTQVQEAAQVELAYVNEIRGPSGRITGMGGGGATPTSAAQLKESFRSLYLRQGKSADEAERMATVAAQGR